MTIRRSCVQTKPHSAGLPRWLFETTGEFILPLHRLWRKDQALASRRRLPPHFSKPSKPTRRKSYTRRTSLTIPEMFWQRAYSRLPGSMNAQDRQHFLLYSLSPQLYINPKEDYAVRSNIGRTCIRICSAQAVNMRSHLNRQTLR